MIKKETERAALTERRHFRDPKTPRGKLPSPLLPGQKGDGRAGRSHCPRPARPSPPRSSPCRPHPLTVRGGAGRWPRPPPPRPRSPPAAAFPPRRARAAALSPALRGPAGCRHVVGRPSWREGVNKPPPLMTRPWPAPA